MIGTRIGQVITNKILASPPLPAIAGKEAKYQLSPLVSSVTVTANSADSQSMDYSGSFKGYSAGLGFTVNAKTKINFYGFATVSETTGSIQSPDFSSQQGIRLSDMINSGTNLSIGASYRPWTENEFPLVVGILGKVMSGKMQTSVRPMLDLMNTSLKKKAENS